jgi:N-acetylglutamate synthase-like GNAT family acetyltransferase
MMMDRGTAELYADWFACLAEPTRLRILNVIATAGRPTTVGDIARAAGVSQATASHHLRLLTEQRFVLGERRGTSTICSINTGCLKRFPDAARAVLGGQLDQPVDAMRRRLTPNADINIRAASVDDLPEMLDLLARHGLPTIGVSHNVTQTLVAELDGQVIGCASLEPHGRSVLLRSVAVSEGLRRTGIGTALVEGVLARWSARRNVYLLTDTAPAFFERLGFREIARDKLPTAIRASDEYTKACAATACAMQLQRAGRRSAWSPRG